MTRQCTISATSSSSPVSLTLSSATASHRIGHLRPQQIGSSSFYMRPSASPLPLSSSSSSLSASSLAPPLLDASDRGFTLIHPRNSTNNNASTPTNTTGRSFSEISEFMSPRLLTAQHACNQPPDGEDAYETVYEEPILCIGKYFDREYALTSGKNGNFRRVPNSMEFCLGVSEHFGSGKTHELTNATLMHSDPTRLYCNSKTI